MVQSFDPYYRWLGIPPHLQPPHHYRLLGLELFENNRDVISEAADRQMTYVRMHQLGPHTEFSQKLLNEIVSAMLCLMMPERKAAYDEELRKKLAENPQPTSEPATQLPQIPAASDSEELKLVPDKPPRVAPPKSVNPSPWSGSLPQPAAPPPVAAGKPIPKVVTPRPRPSDGYTEISPPTIPWKYEPPYMAEYRRRFFESAIKVGIFLFVLAILLMVFHELVLPMFKDQPPPPTPPAKENTPNLRTPADKPIPPPPIKKTSKKKTEKDSKDPSQEVEESEDATLLPSDENTNPVDEEPLYRSKTDFVGCWHIFVEGTYNSSITLNNDLTARDSRFPTVQGKWEYRAYEAHILWKDGWRVVLRSEGKKVRKFSYMPSDPLEKTPVDQGTATKE